MTIHGRQEFTWKDNSLYFQGKAVAEIYPDKLYKQMHWIRWEDKSESPDFYNLTRAKDHAVAVCMKDVNARSEIE